MADVLQFRVQSVQDVFTDVQDVCTDVQDRPKDAFIFVIK
jgi:uncharacterized protein YoxC